MIIKETPTQEFPYKICEIFMNSYFEGHPGTTAWSLYTLLSAIKVRYIKVHAIKVRFNDAFILYGLNNTHSGMTLIIKNKNFIYQLSVNLTLNVNLNLTYLSANNSQHLDKELHIATFSQCRLEHISCDTSNRLFLTCLVKMW